MTDPRPMMTDAEIALLERSLKATDRCWEWGSGSSTLWLAQRVRAVTTVEHQGIYAATLIGRLEGPGAKGNVAVLYAPPDGPYVEGGEQDGDLTNFRTYVTSYTGVGIDVVVLDGRARLACAIQVAEHAHVGPSPGMRIFLHDVQRREYLDIFEDREGWRAPFTVVERVENLIMLAPRFDR